MVSRIAVLCVLALGILSIALYRAVSTPTRLQALNEAGEAGKPRASKTAEPRGGEVRVLKRSHESFELGDLAGLCRRSNLVAVGTVSTLAGNHYAIRAPVNQGTLGSSRVYNFTVSQTLKGSVAPGTTIKVCHTAGATLDGTTYRFAGEPWLTAGNRYVLFLRCEENQAVIRDGFIRGTSGQYSGKTAELDEWFPEDNMQGILLLTGGNAVPNQDAFATAEAEQYPDYAIYNVPESTAISRILSAVAAPFP